MSIDDASKRKRERSRSRSRARSEDTHIDIDIPRPSNSKHTPIDIDIDITLKPKPLSDSEATEKVRAYLMRLEPDELFAIAYLMGESDKKGSTASSREALIEAIYKPLAHRYTHPEPGRNHILDIFENILKAEFLAYVTDNNALRTAYALDQLPYLENPEPESLELKKIFPDADYKRKHLLTELLKSIMESNNRRIGFRIDEWITDHCLPIFEINELKLRDDSKDNRRKFLCELNSQLIKRFPHAAPAKDSREFLIKMDSLIGFDKEHRENLIRKARHSLSQKKSRKSKAQKNFVFNELTISTLEKLAQTHGISETQVVALLINYEKRNPVHLTAFNNRAKALAEATGEPNHSEQPHERSREDDIFGDR